jgi:hypothetical protein
VKGIDIDSIEPHRRDTRKMRHPVPNGPRQGRKEIVNTEPVVHLREPPAIIPREGFSPIDTMRPGTDSGRLAGPQDVGAKGHRALVPKWV